MGTILIKAGEIVLLNLEPIRGGEKGKTRPCLVLVGSGHPWGLIVVLPITDGTQRRSGKFFVSVPVNKKTGLRKTSVVDCFQVRCVTEQRVVKRLGLVPEQLLFEVRKRLALILDIGEEHTLVGC